MIIYCYPFKITINEISFAKVIINIITSLYYAYLDLIIIDKSLFFTLKFLLLLYYFFNIKQKSFIVI